MSKSIVEKGDTVTIEYEGRFEDGKVFDSSTKEGKSHPLVFVAGSGQVIPGFDNAIIGMKVGEEKEVTIEPKEGYGEPNPSLHKEIPKESIPKDQDPKVGMTLLLGTPEGKRFPAKVIEVNESGIVIDLNHPLAGKKLIFKVKVISSKTDTKMKGGE